MIGNFIQNNKKKVVLTLSIQIVCIVVFLFAFIIGNHTNNNGNAYHYQFSNNELSVDFDNNELPTKEIQINNIKDWIKMGEIVNKSEEGIFFKIIINADLDFTDAGSLIPVGTREKPFVGSVIGNDHYFSHVSISSDFENVGLFGCVDKSSIEGLHLSDCVVESTDAMGTGGIIGFSGDSVIANCSFDGQIHSPEGSAGGIVGNNVSGNIIDCCSKGVIVGTTTGWYGLGDNNHYFGNGGIAGDNGGIIFHCKNYATITDDKDEHESNTIKSGGIAGSNSNIIEASINFGHIDGGGIVDSNSRFSTIRGCFNFGDSYAGIAVSSSRNSIIEHCVNYGTVNGRYAGLIVSFWGSSLDEENNGRVEHCYSVKQNNTEMVRRIHSGEEGIKNNYFVPALDNNSINSIVEQIEKEGTEKYYNLVASNNSHKDNQKWVWLVCLTAVFLIFDVFVILRQKWIAWKRFKKAISFIDNNEYYEAIELLQDNPNYKNSKELMISCRNKQIHDSKSTKTLSLGKVDGKPIEWIVIQESEIGLCLLAERALTFDCINQESQSVIWEDTDLYKQLNAICKEKWFSPFERQILIGDISIPSIEDLSAEALKTETLKCKPIQRMENVLSSNGNVYWWILSNQGMEPQDKFPFVTAEGLVSLTGKSVTSKNVAVRPKITVRMMSEI